jgi:hypothetical protein
MACRIGQEEIAFVVLEFDYISIRLQIVTDNLEPYNLVGQPL